MSARDLRQVEWKLKWQQHEGRGKKDEKGEGQQQ
jgi:hypothetical protein